MNITIIGGGNIGTLMAAEMSYRGHTVTVFTSKIELWRKNIEVYNPDDELEFVGQGIIISNEIDKAVQNADIIWITYPAQYFSNLAKKLENIVKPNQLIGIVPGSGGAEFAFVNLIKKGCVLFGLQRVHSIARLKEYGDSVFMLGRKKNLQIGSIPVNMSTQICQYCEQLFDMPCEALPNYLTVTLTPSNPILHTSRLYSMFKNYEEGVIYDKNFLFYEEWSNEASEILIQCDTELQNLCNVIPISLDKVISLCEYYDSPSPEAMTRKLRSIKAFKGIRSPMKKVKTGWIPDLSSCYFSTDFPFGLKIIKDLSDIFEVNTPYIDILWNWYSKLDKENAMNSIKITQKSTDLVRLYQL